MEGIGVNERRRITHDGDVTFPEQKIAAPQRGKVGCDQCSERVFLHVAVARAGHSAGGERKLHQRRTVEAEIALSAP